MIRPLLALSSLVLMAAAPHAPVERGGIITGPARAMLNAEWERQTPGYVMEPERGYCVARYLVVRAPWATAEGETLLYIVTDIMPAVVTGANAWSIQNVGCPPMKDGSPTPVIHTHPASLCWPLEGRCLADSTKMRVPGQCIPSDTDVRTLIRRRLPFSIVQCGPNVFSFYGPPLEEG